MTGVPTGFSDLDRLLNGLHAGPVDHRGRPAGPRARPWPSTRRCRRPTGWTTMGEVRLGDRLLGADGRPTTVVNAFEVRHGRPCFEVEFSRRFGDRRRRRAPVARRGRRASAAPPSSAWRRGRAMTDGGRRRHRGRPRRRHHGRDRRDAAAPVGRPSNHAVDNCSALRTTGARSWPVPRLTVAGVSGSGDRRRSSERQRQRPPTCGALGVLGDKHIPTSYLRASESAAAGAAGRAARRRWSGDADRRRAGTARRPKRLADGRASSCSSASATGARSAAEPVNGTHTGSQVHPRLRPSKLRHKRARGSAAPRVAVHRRGAAGGRRAGSMRARSTTTSTSIWPAEP